MAMPLVQVRLPEAVVKEINALVEKGEYSSKSDVIRDAVRRLTLDKIIGIIPDTGDSAKEVREIRKRLSKQIRRFADIKKINKLAD